ncbi:O-antigen ligase family protein [Desulfocurvus sp. DL9XJH121]
MAGLQAALADRKTAAQTCLALMRWALLFYVVLFPLGISFREIGAVAAAALLAAYYALDFRDSTLARWPLRWLLAAFLAMLAAKGLHSIYPCASWYALKHASYKGFLLLLAGMEAVREARHLRRMAWALALMTAYTGLDGIYQYFYRVDVFGMPISGPRLVAMWETGRIGNLMSLALPPLFALPVLLPPAWTRARRWACSALIMAPGLALWAGAQARSGWFGLCAAAVGFVWLRLGLKKGLLTLALFVALVLVARPHHLTPHILLNAPRWTIWTTALEVFKEYPLLGAGVNCFEAGYKSLGLSFPPDFDPPVPHPHNIYLQFLAETGVIGAIVAFAFLFGLLFWTGRRIRTGIRERKSGAWIAGAGFWAAYLGYLVAGLSAHNFYRTWWLGMAMLMAGTAVGAAMGRMETPESKT